MISTRELVTGERIVLYGGLDATFIGKNIDSFYYTLDGGTYSNDYPYDVAPHTVVDLMGKASA